MLVRKRKLAPFVGWKAHVNVREPFTGNHVCRSTVDFDNASEAEVFCQLVTRSDGRDGLKYLVDPQDEFLSVELYEHTTDGEVYELHFDY